MPTSGKRNASDIDRPLRVLYDGWALIHAPAGGAALHLLALLRHLPEDVTPILALPADPPEWIGRQGFARLETVTAATPAGSRLRWQQWVLPHIERQARARLLHLTGAHAPLSVGLPVVVSPAEVEAFDRRGGWKERWRASAAKAAQPDARVLLPQTGAHNDAAGLPVIAPGGVDEPIPGLPERYALWLPASPRDPREVERLLAVWGLAYPALGEDTPLACLDEPVPAGLPGVLPVKVSSPLQAAAVIRQAAVVLLTGADYAPWDGRLTLALAAGRPVAGVESTGVAALAGPAAYLAPPERDERLSAAVITILVEDAMAEQLSTAALERAASWGSDQFGARLVEAYRLMVSN